MNIEAIRQRLLNNSTTVNVGGVDWKIGKFSAQEGLEVFRFAKGKEDAAEDEPSVIHGYCHMLSKCLLNDTGRMFDSDEGRKQIPTLLPWGDIVELSRHAMDWNGFGDSAKKNLPASSEPD